MKVIKCKLIGYCHGVADTVNKASQCIDRAEVENLPCFSIGKLIHNNDVVTAFEKQGLKVIKSPEDCTPGIALIRAHGIPDELRIKFEDSGFTLIDSTCSNIRKTCDSIREAHANGKIIAVIGAQGHAETKTLLGTRSEGHPIEMNYIPDVESAKMLCAKLPEDSDLMVFTQTTFAQQTYDEIIKILKDRFPRLTIGSLLCPACLVRKEYVKELCLMSSAVVVVGAKQSHNSQDLVRLVQSLGKKAYSVENVNDFTAQADLELSSFNTVGVCSGTSVPESSINDVIQHLEAL